MHAFAISGLFLFLFTGLSAIRRLEGATGLSICLAIAELIDGGIFDGGGNWECLLAQFLRRSYRFLRDFRKISHINVRLKNKFVGENNIYNMNELCLRKCNA